MDFSPLYLHIVLYDVVNDTIFDQLLYVKEVEIKYKNKIHNNVNDLDEIKFSGKVKNTGDDGIILLGCV